MTSEKPCLPGCLCECGDRCDYHGVMGDQFDPSKNPKDHAPGCPKAKNAEPAPAPKVDAEERDFRLSEHRADTKECPCSLKPNHSYSEHPSLVVPAPAEAPKGPVRRPGILEAEKPTPALASVTHGKHYEGCACPDKSRPCTDWEAFKRKLREANAHRLQRDPFDPAAQIVKTLLARIESEQAANAELRAEVERLRGEIWKRDEDAMVAIVNKPDKSPGEILFDEAEKRIATLRARLAEVSEAARRLSEGIKHSTRVVSAEFVQNLDALEAILAKGDK